MYVIQFVKDDKIMIITERAKWTMAFAAGEINWNQKLNHAEPFKVTYQSLILRINIRWVNDGKSTDKVNTRSIPRDSYGNYRQLLQRILYLS